MTFFLKKTGFVVKRCYPYTERYRQMSRSTVKRDDTYRYKKLRMLQLEEYPFRQLKRDVCACT